jgi:hypothetical protein
MHLINHCRPVTVAWHPMPGPGTARHADETQCATDTTGCRPRVKGVALHEAAATHARRTEAARQRGPEGVAWAGPTPMP